jgi:FkbM family methyltransferase
MMIKMPVGRGRAARLIVESGALVTPFVLVDIGARDGLQRRWKPLEPELEVYGFDAAVRVDPQSPHQHYFKMAVGERDGEARMEIPANGYEARITPTGSATVTMRTLDSLYADGTLPKADFVKIDCEGYEPQVLLGAEAYLTASEPLGVDTETNFNTSPTLPRSHFVELFLALNRHSLHLADLRYDGATRGSPLSWPGTCDALFVRKLDQPSPDRLLKMIAVCDLFYLCALGT